MIKLKKLKCRDKFSVFSLVEGHEEISYKSVFFNAWIEYVSSYLSERMINVKEISWLQVLGKNEHLEVLKKCGF